MHKLKENLKKLVKAKDISIAHLARETDIAPQTLNNWLAGAEPRNLNQIKSVADYFKISVDELCFGFGTKPSKKNSFQDYSDEINAGVYEVVLRRIKK